RDYATEVLKRHCDTAAGSTKSPGLCQGLKFTGEEHSQLTGRDRRAPSAEAIVQAHQTDVDVLTDAFRLEEGTGQDGDVDVASAHEQVIVCDAQRPVRREPKLQARADRAAPTGIVGRGKRQASVAIERVIPVAGHGSPALYVEQDVVPGVADLTG